MKQRHLVSSAGEPIDTSRQPKIELKSPYLVKPREDFIPIARRLELSFDGRNTTAPQIVPLATGVDVSAWARAALVFVLHAKNAWLTAGGGPTTAQVELRVESVALDSESPELVFVDTSRVVASSPIISASTVAPLHAVTAFVPPFAPRVRLSARFRQGTTASAGPQTLAVSAYFVGRRA